VILKKYIDGAKVGQGGISWVDDRWSIYTTDDVATPYFILLTDGFGYSNDGYINSFGFVDRTLTEDEAKSLGCPSNGGAFTAGPICKPQCPADYNHDGFVDGIDYDMFNNDFETLCP
jgi:hypothetical protein